MEFKGTTGEAKVEYSHIGGIDSPLSEIDVTVWKERKEDGGRSGYSVFSAKYNGRLTKIDIKKDKANAELIAEAFNIRQQIDCSLTELLERYEEMKKALEECASELGFLSSKIEEKHPRFMKEIEYDYQSQFEYHELLTKHK